MRKKIIASAGVMVKCILFVCFFGCSVNSPQCLRSVLHASRRLGAMLFGMQGIDDGLRPESRTKTLMDFAFFLSTFLGSGSL